MNSFPHFLSRHFNAGMKGGKVTLWEGGHRVPCFIRWPAGGLRAAGDACVLWRRWRLVEDKGLYVYARRLHTWT